MGRGSEKARLKKRDIVNTKLDFILKSFVSAMMEHLLPQIGLTTGEGS